VAKHNQHLDRISGTDLANLNRPGAIEMKKSPPMRRFFERLGVEVGGLKQAGSPRVETPSILSAKPPVPLCFLHFFIDSLFDYSVSWVMEVLLHTFHPCRHPKKK
jgi:hypothetical protein